jgi:hypothetical protein
MERLAEMAVALQRLGGDTTNAVPAVVDMNSAARISRAGWQRFGTL